MKGLHIADTSQILKGDVTDVYFLRTEKILRETGQAKQVCMEVFLKAFPDPCYRWGVFAGLEEVCVLLQGRPVTVRALPEGSIFFPGAPVMSIEGNYLDFGELETAILGCICQASGIATKASRCRVACGDKILVSFGARRMHPCIAPMVERAAYIGGCNGVATVASARLIGEKPIGTMPHALIIQMGGTVNAARAFDELIEKDVPRVVLIDTFEDEKFAALQVAESLGERLYGIRFDTPGSRRGDFKALIEETKWELALRGFEHVRIFVSGGLDAREILALADVADAFGVGTAVASAATLDFSMDIVAMEGVPIAKRGKASGKKSVLRCRSCMRDLVVPYGENRICACSGPTEDILKLVIESGHLVYDLPQPQDIRQRLLTELNQLQKGYSPKELLSL